MSPQGIKKHLEGFELSLGAGEIIQIFYLTQGVSFEPLPCLSLADGMLMGVTLFNVSIYLGHRSLPEAKSQDLPRTSSMESGTGWFHYGTNNLLSGSKTF